MVGGKPKSQSMMQCQQLQESAAQHHLQHRALSKWAPARSETIYPLDIWERATAINYTRVPVPTRVAHCNQTSLLASIFE